MVLPIIKSDTVGLTAVEVLPVIGSGVGGTSKENEFDWPLPVGEPLFVFAEADTVNFVPGEYRFFRVEASILHDPFLSAVATPRYTGPVTPLVAALSGFA